MKKSYFITAAAVSVLATVAVVKNKTPVKLPSAQLPLVAGTSAPTVVGVEADVIAFPVVINHSTHRMNVALMTMSFPPEVWEGAALRSELRVENGTFPVQIWRIRNGVVTEMEPIRVPAESTQLVQFSVGHDFQTGDVLAVEHIPFALLTVPGQWPVASIIDNTSNDPTTLVGTVMRAPLTIRYRKQRATR